MRLARKARLASASKYDAVEPLVELREFHALVPTRRGHWFDYDRHDNHALVQDACVLYKFLQRWWRLF